MKETIEWLMGIEDGARIFYEAAAELYPEDAGLMTLLYSLAADEGFHHRLLESALWQIDVAQPEPGCVVIDTEARHAVEAVVRRHAERLAGGGMTREELLSAVIDIEYSECNEIFIYVLNSLKVLPGHFADAAASIQDHKNTLERYLESAPGLGGLIARAQAIPKTGDEKILIVDGAEGDAELFGVFLSNEGTVRTARSAHDALRAIDRFGSSVVITDFALEGMDGMELYRTAVGRHPRLSGRFIFYSDEFPPGATDFLDENGIEWLSRPVRLSELRRAFAVATAPEAEARRAAR